MADLIMEKIFKKTFFTWGGNNLVQQTNARAMYIKAVKLADDNDIKTLVAFAKS